MCAGGAGPRGRARAASRPSPPALHAEVGLGERRRARRAARRARTAAPPGTSSRARRASSPPSSSSGIGGQHLRLPLVAASGCGWSPAAARARSRSTTSRRSVAGERADDHVRRRAVGEARSSTRERAGEVARLDGVAEREERILTRRASRARPRRRRRSPCGRRRTRRASRPRSRARARRRRRSAASRASPAASTRLPVPARSVSITGPSTSRCVVPGPLASRRASVTPPPGRRELLHEREPSVDLAGGDDEHVARREARARAARRARAASSFADLQLALDCAQRAARRDERRVECVLARRRARAPSVSPPGGAVVGAARSFALQPAFAASARSRRARLALAALRPLLARARGTPRPPSSFEVRNAGSWTSTTLPPPKSPPVASSAATSAGRRRRVELDEVQRARVLRDERRGELPRGAAGEERVAVEEVHRPRRSRARVGEAESRASRVAAARRRARHGGR